MSTVLHSYPKVYNLGHAAVKEIFQDPIIVQEKIDGSQLSFGQFGDKNGSILIVKSKGAQINLNDPNKMFLPAVAHILKLARDHKLCLNYTYRCEYLQKPKHNVLAYDRIPRNHLMLFDINDGEESYLQDHDAIMRWAEKLEIEAVPQYATTNRILTPEDLIQLLEKQSCLGKQKIEGVVIKNYHRFGSDKKALMVKFVSPDFKEIHQKQWKKEQTDRQNFIPLLAEQYRTPARWNKAVIHLREQGLIEDSPRDIGKLMPEVVRDIEEECQDEIKEQLYQHFARELKSGFTKGLPEWYKERLLKKQFEH